VFRTSNQQPVTDHPRSIRNLSKRIPVGEQSINDDLERIRNSQKGGFQAGDVVDESLNILHTGFPTWLEPQPKGEEEIKRRLQLPGGWEGLTLVKDRRDDGCGYDFLCKLSGQEVMLEIKTFFRGSSIVSTTELGMAFTGGMTTILWESHTRTSHEGGHSPS
jgi:hypothetical protein